MSRASGGLFDQKRADVSSLPRSAGFAGWLSGYVGYGFEEVGDGLLGAEALGE